MRAETKVFRDRDGNRMVFPGLIMYEGEYHMDKSKIWTFQMMITLNTDMTAEDDWLVFESSDFPHVVGTIGHRIFQHGGTNVWMFAGPEFDRIKKEVEDERAAQSSAAIQSE